jgi:flagellar hook-associated protein 3 FlgL
MRVTQGMMSYNMLRDVNSSMERMSRLQDMLSSGKQISKPSDDPIGTIRSLSYRTKLMQIDQYKSNTNEAINWFDATDSALSQAVNVLHTIQDKINQAASDTLTPDDREKIVEEVKQLREQLGTIANTTLDDRYIFNGTDTQNAPYDTTTSQFTGTNSNALKLELSPAVTMQVNVDGKELFGNKADGSPGLFTTLDKVIQDMQTKTGKDISNDLGDIQKHIDYFLTVQAQVGARTNRVEMIQDRLTNQNEAAENTLSSIEDTDATKTIMDLQLQENVHRAALAAGSRIIQPTLVDFMK